MELTASFKLFANESLRKLCLCTSLSATVPLPEPIKPTTPINIGLLYYFFKRFSISLIAFLTDLNIDALRVFLRSFNAFMLIISNSSTNFSSSSSDRSEYFLYLEFFIAGYLNGDLGQLTNNKTVWCSTFLEVSYVRFQSLHLCLALSFQCVTVKCSTTLWTSDGIEFTSRLS